MRSILEARTHGDLIEALVEMFDYESYLEIGCQGDATFGRINVPRKVGVDPVSGGTHRMTSNDYFARHGEMFDAIFIDGDHRHTQVYLDALHALRVLLDGGILFLHDCSPPDAAHEAPHLCHTAWRAFANLRQHPYLDGIVADWDFGTALIRVGRNTNPIVLDKSMDALRWEDFEAHRKDWMRLSSHAEVDAWLAQ